MATYAIIEAPSVLGLFPRGVELLPEALLESGLAGSLGARHAGRVPSPAYDSQRDEATGLLNPRSLRDYSRALADATGVVLDAGDVPVVLGGDCSILLDTMLALRRRGRYGLLFLDGHADFYQPEAEPGGEAASMDLALVTGRGPEIERAKEFWAVLGYQWTPRHPRAALLTFANGMNLVLHEPGFARLWDPAYSGPSAGSTVIDVNLSSREDVDDAHGRVVAAGYPSSVEPWDTFFGARYAIVCDADGHRIGLKIPQDPSRADPLDE
ncbi:MAG: arginase family protein [Euzebya sp.]